MRNSVIRSHNSKVVSHKMSCRLISYQRWEGNLLSLMHGSPATFRCVEEMVVLYRRIPGYAIGLGNQTAQFSNL